MASRAPLEQRFWSKVDKRGPDECWLWTGAKDGSGYGRISVGNINRRASRVVWQIAHGSLAPDGLCVCHSCDNRICVNPAHLWLGTPSDNNRDMWDKGRAPARSRAFISSIRPRGEASGRAKLTTDAVVSIVLSNSDHASLARQHGVSAAHIREIRRGKTWKHVTAPLLGDAQ